jgi:hypothetical protein
MRYYKNSLSTALADLYPETYFNVEKFLQFKGVLIKMLIGQFRSLTNSYVVRKE